MVNGLYVPFTDSATAFGVSPHSLVLSSHGSAGKAKWFLSLLFLLVESVGFGQTIVDSCFSSAGPSPGFVSSSDLANLGSTQADLLQWDGTSWIGALPTADLTIPPPSNGAGCRAIFIGNATTWTTGGEGFGLRLDTTLVAGQTYSFAFNYVSQGFGSDAAFSPSIYTGYLPGLYYYVGDLPAVGNTWTTNSISFTATPEQAAHNWLMVTTAPEGSSGLINSFCQNCNDTSLVNCSIDLGGDRTLCEGNTLLLHASTPDATYLWQDNSTDPTFNVTEDGTYWVRVTRSNCSEVDTVHVAFKNCNLTLDLPNVFTPNQDGQNDLFVPISTQGIVSVHTTIRNRWGQVIFETDRLTIGWDGKDAPEGTYFWIASYVDVEGNSKVAKGYVALLR